MNHVFAQTALAVWLLMPCALYGQVPEKQRSFAQESRPHAWYVAQAGLWWGELQKDSLSEENWYNYFRACRNAQGTADWRTDFVKESPYLKPGADIMALIRKQIPNTFTCYYLSYLNEGIGTGNSAQLLRAYAMNPRFEGIHSSMVSYAESSMDTALRRKVNKEWYPTNYLSPQLLAYGYNVLMSLGRNAVLLTQQDNDTYPVWMLQDALGIRTDVTVINIDFLLLDPYRDSVFRRLHIPPMPLAVRSSDDYHLNWQKAVGHILTHYRGGQPLYVGMTLFDALYAPFKNDLIVSGLALKYTREKNDLTAWNRKCYEDLFLLDRLRYPFAVDPNQGNVNYQNLNYINLLKIMYDYYTAKHLPDKTAEVSRLALMLAERAGNENYIKMTRATFH